MKFTTAIAAAILGAATTLAVPVPAQTSTATVLYPKVTSQYNVWTGAVDFNVNTGLIRKDGKNPDITTLLTVEFPASTAGKQCQFAFTLDSLSTFSGSAKFDLFTSLAPAAGPTTTWPNGNLRDQYGGRFQAQLGDATPIEHANPKFPCPAGQTLGGELVGVYDNDHIEWNVDTPGTGPKILVS